MSMSMQSQLQSPVSNNFSTVLEILKKTHKQEIAARQITEVFEQKMNLLNTRIIKQRSFIESLKKENRRNQTILCDDRYSNLDGDFSMNRKSVFNNTQNLMTAGTTNTTVTKMAATIFESRSNSYQIPKKKSRAQSAVMVKGKFLK